MQYTPFTFLIASLSLAPVAAHAGDSTESVNTYGMVTQAQLSNVPLASLKLSLLDAQKVSPAQNNVAALANAAQAAAAANTLPAAQRSVVPGVSERNPALAQENDSGSAPSVAWPLLLGLLIVFLRRAPQRFRSNGL
jgi:hypothetical protein